jgi:aryl-alcohol dehydrogenase-like predicted oxidoreductase
MNFGDPTDEAESIRIMNSAVEASINFFDTANIYNYGRSEEIVEALWTSSELRLHRFICEQPPYNLLERQIERELVPMALTYGIALIPWSPLSGGLLTGKYTRSGPAPEGSRYEKGAAFADRVYDAVEALESMAREKDCTLSQLSLAWCGQQFGVTAPIIGPRTSEQLADNLKALDVTFTDEELNRIDRIAPPGEALVPLYKADFGPSKFR